MLGRQVERSRTGRRHFKVLPGGQTCADLFPELVGQTFEITNKGVDLADQPRMIECVQWLGANGYL